MRSVWESTKAGRVVRNPPSSWQEVDGGFPSRAVQFGRIFSSADTTHDSWSLKKKSGGGVVKGANTKAGFLPCFNSVRLQDKQNRHCEFSVVGRGEGHSSRQKQSQEAGKLQLCSRLSAWLTGSAALGTYVVPLTAFFLSFFLLASSAHTACWFLSATFHFGKEPCSYFQPHFIKALYCLSKCDSHFQCFGGNIVWRHEDNTHTFSHGNEAILDMAETQQLEQLTSSVCWHEVLISAWLKMRATTRRW